MAKAPEPAGLLIAKESWTGLLGDSLVEVHVGDIAEAGSPAVRQWPDKFTPVEPRFRRPMPAVEQATAAPGEKRGA